MKEVWVFSEHGLTYPVGIFSTKLLAEEWIVLHRPIGILTKVILDKPDDTDFPEHYHYEDDDDYQWLENRLNKAKV